MVIKVFRTINCDARVEESAAIDNGFFTDDNSTPQTKEEHENDKSNHAAKNEKVLPRSANDASILADKITVDSNNEGLVTIVKDDDTKLP